GARQRKGVGRNDAYIALEIHEGLLVEALGVHDGGVDIGENLEFIGAADIVAIAAGAIAYDFMSVHFPHLTRLERADHAALRRLPDPPVVLDTHTLYLSCWG